MRMTINIFMANTSANTHPSIIGSIKEGTRAFFNNEVDVHISLSKVLVLLWPRQPTAEGKSRSEGTAHQKIFDCKKLSLDFMGCLENDLGKFDIRQGFIIGDNHHNCGNYCTLRGLMCVYVLIKILKFCTGSLVKSYQCKFAISDVLVNRFRSDVEELGDLIQEVIYLLSGKVLLRPPWVEARGKNQGWGGKGGASLHLGLRCLAIFILINSNFDKKYWTEKDVRESTMTCLPGFDEDEELLTHWVKPLLSQRKMRTRMTKKNFWGKQSFCHWKNWNDPWLWLFGRSFSPADKMAQIFQYRWR